MIERKPIIEEERERERKKEKRRKIWRDGKEEGKMLAFLTKKEKELPELVEYVLEHHPEYVGHLSMNREITLETIVATPELPWSAHLVSSNPNLTLDFVLRHPQSKWDWTEVLKNAILSLAQVLSIPNLFKKIPFSPVGANRHISLEDITRGSLSAPWDLHYISQNPNLTLDFVLNPPAHLKKQSWNWAELSRNSAFSLKTILSRPDLPWIPAYVSRNASLRDGDVFTYPEYPWHWEGIAINPGISLALILNHPQKIWRYQTFNRNPCLKLAEILLYLHDDRCDWDWPTLIRYVSTTSRER